MMIPSIVCALPGPAPTGWGVAGKRIPEELAKIAMVTDLNTGDRYLNSDIPVDFSVPLLQAARAADMLPQYPQLCSDTQNVAYCFVEDDLLLQDYATNALRHFDHIVCGSEWAVGKMREALRVNRIEMPVTRAIQGVDIDIFCPVDERQTDPKWFTVLSAGKWEYRKAQDVVIRAMAVMMERHADVRLLAAWHNPWPHSAATMRQSKLIEIVPAEYPLIDIERSAWRNGIKQDRAEFLRGLVAHGEMPSVYRRADIALFPNRCEAGTNLPLMEAQACGLPVIATEGHGHDDVMRHIGMLRLVNASPCAAASCGKQTGRWIEPNLDELIMKLEFAYEKWRSNPEFLYQQGLVNRTAMYPFSWAQTARSLLDACV